MRSHDCRRVWNGCIIRATVDGHCLGVQAREARFEEVAGGDLRDETLLTAACQELRAAPSKIGSSLPDEYSVAGIVLPTVNFMILAGQYPEEVPLAGVFGNRFARCLILL